MTVKLESAVETELVMRVRALGGRCDKVRLDGARGYFDRIIVLKGGRVIFAELKRPTGGRVSPHQMLCHSVYRELGAEVVLIRNSADIDALLRQ